MTEAAAFDQVATVYDEAMHAPPGVWYRQRVVDRLLELFGPGQHVLELGCGTGDDALHLAEAGIDVTGVDASAGMLDQARLKVEASSARGTVRLLRHDLNQTDPELDQRFAGAQFDGAFSDFGAINCVRDRRRLGRQLSRLLAPGSPVVLVGMARWCPFEIGFHLLRLRPGVAFRRLHDGRPAKVGSAEIQVDYPSAGRLCRELGADFELTRVWPLGVLLPPTDLLAFGRRLPKLLDLLRGLDERVGWPRQLADHYVAELRIGGRSS